MICHVKEFLKKQGLEPSLNLEQRTVRGIVEGVTKNLGVATWEEANQGSKMRIYEVRVFVIFISVQNIPMYPQLKWISINHHSMVSGFAF